MAGRVVHEDEVGADLVHTKPPLSPGDLSTRTLVDRVAGSGSLVQSVLHIRGEVALEPSDEDENVLYVVQGGGWFMVEEAGGEPLWPGTAALVPPGSACRISRTSAEDLVVVSVLARGPKAAAAQTGPYGPMVIREEDQSSTAAGRDRMFRILIDPLSGARHVTQFVGFIRRGAASFHEHPHEEAIYVVSGSGIAHLQDGSHPIRRGSSVYLPAGTRHSLENEGEQELKVLGVFSPPGSPATRTERKG